MIKLNVIKINGIYKHFKGDYYIVLDIGTNTEDEKKYVIYRGLYENSPLWIRPLDSFLSEVDQQKYPNIKQKYRFELQNIKSKKN